MANSSVVGTLRAILSADTAEFATAMRKGADAADQAAKDITKAGAAFQALEPRMASVTRLVKDFSGSLERRSAEEFAMAIDKIGGAAKLSEGELRRAQGVFSDYISKAKAMGQEVPAHIQKVSDEIGKLSSVSGKSAGIIGDIRGAFQNLGPSVLAAAGGFATALISVEALTQGLRAAIQFVKDSITQYLEAEKAQRKLVAALEAQRTATPETIRAYKDLANEFQRTTVFSDELIMEMETLLVQVGNVMPQEMKGALEAVTNLASGLGIDLRSATMLVAKSFEDNFTALGRAGVVIDQTRAKAEGMTYVLGQIQAKFGGQAQADLKSFSGQLQQTGNQFDELKETIGGVIVQSTAFQVAFALLRGEILKLESDIKLVVGTLKLMGSIPGPVGASFRNIIGDLNGTSTSLTNVNSAIAEYNRMKWGVNPNLPKEWTNYAQKLDDVRERLSKLQPEQLAQIKAAQALHAPLNDLAKLYGFTVEELNLLTKETKENKKEVNASEKAYRDWADEVSGAKLLKSLDELEDKLKRLTREGGLNARASKAIAEEYDGLLKKGAPVRAALQTLHNEFIGLRTGIVATAVALPQLTDRFNLTSDEIKELAKDFQDINKKVEDFNKIINTSKGVEGLFKGGISGKEIIDEQQIATLRKQQVDLVKGLDSAAASFALLGKIATGTMADVSSAVGAGASIVADFAAGSASALNAGLAMFNVFSGIADSLNAEAALAGHLRGIRNTVNDLADDFGLVNDQLAFSSELAERILQTQFDIRDATMRTTLFGPGSASDRELLALNKVRAEALNILDIVEELGGVTDQNLAAILAKAEPLFDLMAQGGRLGAEATRVWDELINQIAEAKGWFDVLDKAVADFGGKAPAALQPLIQQLLASSHLSEEIRDQLEALAGAPEWEQLQSIAQKYGIELGALGQSFQDARIGDIAMQYARDFMTLRDAGGDVNGLLIGMQDEVQALVNDALKFGTAMPEALRPVLEGLLQMGLLTDENGNKLDDLSRFSFTGTLEDAFKDMKSILEEIRDLLAGGLPNAARSGSQQVEQEYKSVFDRIRDKARNTTLTVPVEFDYGAFSPPSGFAVPGAAEGGYISKTGPIVAHAGEVIGPLDQLTSMFGDVRIDNRLFIDGREVTTSVVRHLREEARRLGTRPI